MKARMESAKLGLKPAVGRYLDTAGNEHEWEELEGQNANDGSSSGNQGLLSYINPFAWYRYYAMDSAGKMSTAHAQDNTEAADEKV